MEIAQPPVIPTPGSRRLAVFLKIASICLLIPFLHIPLFMTHGVLRERQGYQNQADQEIAETWGKSQMVVGPVLMVPWSRAMTRKKAITGSDGKVAYEEEGYTVGGNLYYLPEVLTIEGRIEPEVRYRGIYESIVYAAGLKLSGSFMAEPPKDALPKTVYHWDFARLYFGTTDPRRLRAAPKVTWDGGESVVESNAMMEAINLGLVSAVKVAATGRADFRIEMQLQGSGRFEVVPLGRQTQVNMGSPWQDPSFTGAFLPASRSIGSQGFSAKWELGPYGREYPFAWNSKETDTKTIVDKFTGSSLGVVLARPVNAYSIVERAQKYGVLFFVLVFAVFFLFEVTTPALRIHPLQYAMVGAALALFFLGFLALSEFLPAGSAYAVAAGLCTLLVSLYAWSFLRAGWRTLVIGGGLGATYGYLYFVLKSQDYALVAGTAALFAAMALVMFCTRRINWYSLEMNAVTAGADR